MHIYLINDGEKHWISANDKNHAIEVYAVNSGWESSSAYLADYGETMTVEELPDDSILDVGDFDEPAAPRTSKTCAAWTANGAGLIATTCF